MLRLTHRSTTPLQLACLTHLPHLERHPLRSLLEVLWLQETVLYNIKLPRPFEVLAIVVSCIPGARMTDITGNFRVLSKRRFSNIVIHLDANDVGHIQLLVRWERCVNYHTFSRWEDIHHTSKGAALISYNIAHGRPS